MAYPTLVTIEPKGRKKIHRFSGFLEAKPFKGKLDEALERWDLFKAGKEWDEAASRPSKICDEGELESIPAPSDEVPGGLVLQGTSLWVAQGGKLFKTDPKDGKVAATFDLEGSAVGLATDGEFLYAQDYGWTSGGPIRVIDPATGRKERDIVTAERKETGYYAAGGLAFRDGKLIALDRHGAAIHEVDPLTGKLGGNVTFPEKGIAGLAFDGRRYITAKDGALLFLHRDTGEIVRKVPLNYPVRALAWDGGTLFIMEQPVWGFDKDHKQVRVWPKETRIWKLKLPEEKAK